VLWILKSQFCRADDIVEAVGAEVTSFRPGERVWYAGSITRPGANSELHAVDERIVSHAPASFSDAQAAALLLTSITAYELLFERLGVPVGGSAGQTLLKQFRCNQQRS